MNNLDTASGSAVYSPFTLGWIYDVIVLRLYCSYAWGCPREVVRSFYSKHVASVAERSSKVSCRLLDIGVGTGFFLEHASIPPGSEVTLADLNVDCLKTAASRVSRAHPDVFIKTVVADVLEPDQHAGINDRQQERSLALSPSRLGGAKFDVISCLLLLHCLPGPPQRKAEAVVHLARHLDEGGTVIGATVLGQDVQHNPLGRFIMFWQNLLGIFNNYADDVTGLVGPLEVGFREVKWELIGKVLFFEAKL